MDEFPAIAMRALVKDFPKSSIFAQGGRSSINQSAIELFVVMVFEPLKGQRLQRYVITDYIQIIPVWQ